MQTDATGQIRIALETGQKRVFACALDWPGWCRAGNAEADAQDALVAYAGRYAAVAHEAGLAFTTPEPSHLQVVERLTGSRGYTDFGVPGVVAASDRAQLSGAEAARLAALVRAAWVVFDRIAAASPAMLRKGPRGGGRDRDKIVDHMLGAEAAYARKLGIKQRQPARDHTDAIAALHAAIVAALTTATEGTPTTTGWPPRYAARRIAWLWWPKRTSKRTTPPFRCEKWAACSCLHPTVTKAMLHLRDVVMVGQSLYNLWC